MTARGAARTSSFVGAYSGTRRRERARASPRTSPARRALVERVERARARVPASASRRGRDADLRVRRRRDGLAVGEELLVQLLARAAARSRGSRCRGPGTKPASEIMRRARSSIRTGRAHVEVEDLAALAPSPRPGGRGSTASGIVMKYRVASWCVTRDRAAALDLAEEERDDGARAADDVAEAHGDAHGAGPRAPPAAPSRPRAWWPPSRSTGATALSRRDEEELRDADAVRLARAGAASRARCCARPRAGSPP